MPVIDADTHIDECGDTWSYLRSDELNYKLAAGETQPVDGALPFGFWMVDGVARLRPLRRQDEKYLTEGTRLLRNVPERLRAMDEFGVDVQIIYPSLFLAGGVGRDAVELALFRSYNRWMADRCEQSGGRLRWIMLPPLQSMDKTLEELRFGKEHGAVGVLKKGDLEADHWPSEPYFYPLYAEAERLGLPICFHVGTGATEAMPLDRMPYFSFHRIILPTVHAFQSLISFQVPARFPGVRWGFIEASSSWIPFVLYHMRRILAKGATRFMSGAEYQINADVLDENHIWVSCQVDEDLPYILKHTGEDHLMIGSDFTHHDTGEELQFVELLKQRSAGGDISPGVVHKITSDNPRAFYGL